LSVGWRVGDVDRRSGNLFNVRGTKEEGGNRGERLVNKEQDAEFILGYD
jgi:hypothetical protein